MTDRDGTLGPYRSPALDRLGDVVRTFAVPRRPRYLGAGGGPRGGYLGLSAMNLPRAGSSSLSWLRAPRSEAVEVCERGLRVRSKTGVLELPYDQLAAWDAVTVDGAVVAIELRGVHGEALRLGGVLRGLDELYALVAARRPPPP
ncbi:MAG: hypothetical protein JNK64_39675 [Myxococcales bacterium]|nr:hypothetical protein [Myxococcales bacterium]